MAPLAAAAVVEHDSSCKVHSSVTVSNRVLRSSWGRDDSSSGTAERHGHVAAIECAAALRASVSNSASLIISMDRPAHTGHSAACDLATCRRVCTPPWLHPCTAPRCRSRPASCLYILPRDSRVVQGRRSSCLAAIGPPIDISFSRAPSKS